MRSIDLDISSNSILKEVKIKEPEKHTPEKVNQTLGQANQRSASPTPAGKAAAPSKSSEDVVKKKQLAEPGKVTQKVVKKSDQIDKPTQPVDRK